MRRKIYLDCDGEGGYVTVGKIIEIDDDKWKKMSGSEQEAYCCKIAHGMIDWSFCHFECDKEGKKLEGEG